MKKMLAKTTTFYIKCSAEEAAAIRAVVKKEQRTIHNWLRVVVFADVMKTDPNLLYPPLKCELCGAFMNISGTGYKKTLVDEKLRGS